MLLARLHDRVTTFRRLAVTAGLPLTESTTPIQPIMIGDDARATALSAAVQAAGYYVRAIRPPTVPVGTARLRITLTASHTDEQIAGLITVLAENLFP